MMSALRKGRKWISSRLFAVLVVLVGFAASEPGCVRGKSVAGSNGVDLGSPAEDELPKDANQLIEMLDRQNLEAELVFSPTTATWLGDHRNDGLLDDVRTDAYAREITRIRTLVERLDRMEERKLDAAHRQERWAMMHRAQNGLFELSDQHPLERNPLLYVQIASSGISELLNDFAPLPERIRNLNARLRRMRPLFDEARRNLRGTAGDLMVRRAIDVAQSEKGFVVDQLPKIVQSLGEGKSTDEFRAASGDAARAIDDFVAFLQKDLLPRAHGDLALGRDRFMQKLEASEGLTFSPEALMAIGERETKDSRRRIDELTKQILVGRPAGTDVTKVIEDDHGKAEELLPQAQGQVDALVAFLKSHDLLDLPRAPGIERPLVVEMPPEKWGYVMLHVAGPLEGKPHDPVVYVDPVDKTWTRKQEHLRLLNHSAMLAALLHELVGHYIQGEQNRQIASLPLRAAFDPFFLEGWAHYAERMLLAEGFAPDDPRVRMQVERTTLLKAARLVASVKLHALGARLEDAVKVFTDEAGLDDAGAKHEAERVAADPMVLGDTVGRLILQKLQVDWLAAHANDDLSDFHAAVLSHGSLPPIALRRLLLPEDANAPL